MIARAEPPRHDADGAQDRHAEEQREDRDQPPVVVVPVSKAGSSTWSVDQPSTQASATVSAPNRTLPSVESVKTHGSRRMATPSTRKPPIRVEVLGARLTGSAASGCIDTTSATLGGAPDIPHSR